MVDKEAQAALGRTQKMAWPKDIAYLLQKDCKDYYYDTILAKAQWSGKATKPPEEKNKKRTRRASSQTSRKRVLAAGECGAEKSTPGGAATPCLPEGGRFTRELKTCRQN